MKLRMRRPSAAAVLALAVAGGAAAGGSSTARAAQQEPAPEPAPLIQLEVDVTASGAGEGTGENTGRRTWRVSTRAPAGEVSVTAELAELFAQASRSSDGAIVLDPLIVRVYRPTVLGRVPANLVIESRTRDLVLRDGERTVVLESTDSANGAVTIAVTASALDEPAGQRAAGSAAPIRVGDGVPPPRKVHDVPPVYPAAARTLRVQGQVILEATIGPTGEVVDVEVLRSVPELDEAAVAAVEQWRYEPTLVAGEAVPVIMTVTINFSLRSGDDAPRRLPPPEGEPAQPAENPGSGAVALEGTQDGAIFGQVVDAAGEPLPGTTIEAATPVLTRVEVADRQGEYRISNLPPGTYTVTFSLPGFSPVVRNEVVVGSGRASGVVAVLAVGGTDDSFSVVFEGPGPQGGNRAAALECTFLPSGAIVGCRPVGVAGQRFPRDR